MQVSIKNLLSIYDLEVRKNCRNKRKIYYFEKNKMQNIVSIYNCLKDKSYFPSKYNIFIIRDPKYRIVMSLNIFDKVINHYLARYVLIKKLDKYLDHRCVATRTNYGTDYGIKLVKKYLEKCKRCGKFYILKIDIKKYFYNIDHQVLKKLLIDKLDYDEYELLSRIIDSTNLDYINQDISKLINKACKKHPKEQSKILELPFYKIGKGLSLGAMTSQFLSIFYLYKLDHFIVYDLKLKYMVHYMDDIVIFHTNKKYLEECLKKIEKMLYDYFKLEINTKKTKIVSSKEGFTFLGYTFKIYNNKTVIKVKQATLKKIKTRIKNLKYLYNLNFCSFEKVFCSLNTYLYSFKYADNIKIKRFITKLFFIKSRKILVSVNNI